ncbi:nitric oxide synthase oxygenase [Actinacidiphila alni]|uniref:nitric oxide synthase oxygenase n=1 Tax=Actinacidiphila alni TaxID=380248 RepID=UPI00345475CD
MAGRAKLRAARELGRKAEEFLRLYHGEEVSAGDLDSRLAAVRAEIAETGTYRHTTAELAFGARVAWRNSNRCIGRLYWRSLQVRDLRHLTDAEDIARECAQHLRLATNSGRIRPLITVFAPDSPDRRGPRIRNEQLIRYAGYRAADGTVTGDPLNAGLTDRALRLGWTGGPGTAFDVLPLIVEGVHDKPRLFELPQDAVLHVPLDHPERPWSRHWGLRWHAVPAISAMCLEIGGVCYGAAPFNGWYMGTEIGARNLADTDRYDLLPRVAEDFGMDTGSVRSLWKDRALVELNRAVLHSFDRAGVTLADHHTEAERFLQHMERERRRGRAVHAEWSWIVPPMSGATTGVFHRNYDNTVHSPGFVRHTDGADDMAGSGGADGAGHGAAGAAEVR